MPEHRAGAPEAADHLVDDQQHAVALARRLDRRHVGVRRDQDPAAGDDRLHDHRGHGLGQLELDGALQVGGTAAPVVREVFPGDPVAERVRRRHVEEAGRQRLVAGAPHRLPGRRQGAERGAVVGPVAGDDLEAARLTAQLVVLAHELERQLVRLRAGVRVVRRAVAAQQGLQPLAELDRGDVAARERVERELLQLLRRRVREPLAAVADVDAPLAGEPVEVALALDVGDPRAVALGDDHRPLRALGRAPAHLMPDGAVARAPVGAPRHPLHPYAAVPRCQPDRASARQRERRRGEVEQRHERLLGPSRARARRTPARTRRRTASRRRRAAARPPPGG